MDTTLIINPGSSSKKYALFVGGHEVLSLTYEHTGNGFGKCVEVNKTRQHCEDTTGEEYARALQFVIERAKQEGVIATSTDIARIGVRIVAPGAFFAVHRPITDVYIEQLTALTHVAPLHVPHALEELTAVRSLLPHAALFGISDSAFHTTMPAPVRRYSIDTKLAHTIDLARYGYHGLSVSSVVRSIAQEAGQVPHRMVVCHIGSGVSVTALLDGKSVDTTMGFAPTSGLIMGTRAGDVDPDAFLHLMRTQGGTAEKLETIVSKNGGLKGLLGNADLRVALDRMARGDREGEVAVQMYIGGIRKAIGAYAAVLGGIDVLVLTATAAERNPTVRALITENFEYLGLSIDTSQNESLAGHAGVFSTQKSAVQARVVHTAEMTEMMHCTIAL